MASSSSSEQVDWNGLITGLNALQRPTPNAGTRLVFEGASDKYQERYLKFVEQEKFEEAKAARQARDVCRNAVKELEWVSADVDDVRRRANAEVGRIYADFRERKQQKQQQQQQQEQQWQQILQLQQQQQQQQEWHRQQQQLILQMQQQIQQMQQQVHPPTQLQIGSDIDISREVDTTSSIHMSQELRTHFRSMVQDTHKQFLRDVGETIKKIHADDTANLLGATELAKHPLSQIMVELLDLFRDTLDARTKCVGKTIDAGEMEVRYVFDRLESTGVLSEAIYILSVYVAGLESEMFSMSAKMQEFSNSIQEMLQVYSRRAREHDVLGGSAGI